jgi:hypothetical protein
MDYEPGPEPLRDPNFPPRTPPFSPEFHSLAVQFAGELANGDRALTVQRNDVAVAGAVDIEGEFAAIVGQAIGEFGHQLGTLGSLDPHRVENALRESIDETNGTASRLPSEHGGPQMGGIPGQGSDGFEHVEWVTHDEAREYIEGRPPHGPPTPAPPPEP